MNRIITIGREFGSGGRELGRRLSEIMGIAYYDQEVITEISRRTEMSEQYIRHIMDQRPVISYPIHIGRHFMVSANPVLQQSQEVFFRQREILRELAEKSDCIIIGRCADYILADREPARLFIYADMKSKIRRCREKDPEENRTDAVLEREILKIDKGRAAYYNHFTGQEWGNREHYDLCINTTNCEIKSLAQRLSGMFY